MQISNLHRSVEKLRQPLGPCPTSLRIKKLEHCERRQPSAEDTLGKARDLTRSNGFSQRGLGYLTVSLAGVDLFFTIRSHSTSAEDESILADFLGLLYSSTALKPSCLLFHLPSRCLHILKNIVHLIESC